MSQRINCNYARTAIRVLSQEEFAQCDGIAKRLTRASLLKIVEEYNRIFSDQRPSMNLTTDITEKRVHQLLDMFNKRWHPSNQRNVFLDAFSQSAWHRLPSEEKDKHTLAQCSACRTQHLSLTLSFPDKRDKILLKREMPAIAFNEHLLLTSERKLLKNSITFARINFGNRLKLS